MTDLRNFELQTDELMERLNNSNEKTMRVVTEGCESITEHNDRLDKFLQAMNIQDDNLFVSDEPLLDTVGKGNDDLENELQELRQHSDRAKQEWQQICGGVRNILVDDIPHDLIVAYIRNW